MGGYPLSLKIMKHANIGHAYYRNTNSVLMNNTSIKN